MSLSSEASKWFDVYIMLFFYYQFSIFTHVHDYFLLLSKNDLFSIIPKTQYCLCVNTSVYVCVCVLSSHLSGGEVFPGQLHPAGHQIMPIYYTDRLTQWTEVIPCHHCLFLCLCHLFTLKVSFILTHSLVYNPGLGKIYNNDQDIFITICWCFTTPICLIATMWHNWIM